MNISKFILNKILGWKVKNTLPDVPKCIIVVAPHTSNWDFIIGKLAYSSIGRTANFLIKKEWFIFPFNLFFKSIGGIPVERNKNNSLTGVLAAEFEKHDKLHLAITPEGTRKPVKEWKKGFYFIAMKAKVPILLIGLDYSRKEASLLDLFYPSGDYKTDIVKIKSCYKDIKGRHPERFIL
ncbi:MAG TPA: acyltransferase [Petrimonas sp.]|uniref:1-acyl-sn-glycerol-3-phosphate acyltransferase n=2 Tax=Petrimonas sp. TaxID=2023866 RepID=UPI00176CF471|nr:1-acyl-sn-glycerol-3-phosphate acyltransferase [Petrimonas sp.]MEA4978455.1 1-acyl-sn-glycerol-3-phosphate acyltransferase [Petrimonas sp.]HHV86902.1 acyltransferase [Petrimonas sp.]